MESATALCVQFISLNVLLEQSTRFIQSALTSANEFPSRDCMDIFPPQEGVYMCLRDRRIKWDKEWEKQIQRKDFTGLAFVKYVQCLQGGILLWQIIDFSLPLTDCATTWEIFKPTSRKWNTSGSVAGS